MAKRKSAPARDVPRRVALFASLSDEDARTCYIGQTTTPIPAGTWLLLRYEKGIQGMLAMSGKSQDAAEKLLVYSGLHAATRYKLILQLWGEVCRAFGKEKIDGIIREQKGARR